MEEALLTVKVGRKKRKGKLPVIEGFPLLVDTSSSEDEVAEYIAQEKRLERRRENRKMGLGLNLGLLRRF